MDNPDYFCAYHMYGRISEDILIILSKSSLNSYEDRGQFNILDVDSMILAMLL